MMKDLAYRLWLSIIEIGLTSLSMNICHIKYNQNCSLSSYRQSYKQSELRIQQKKNQQSLSQLDLIRKKNTVKVALTDGKAYWVHDNIFYESDLIDGHIDNENIRAIDAFKLTKKQLNELLIILDGINKN